ncbi:prolyl oligopeptidase family serine peptidase [Brevibacterium paucivorans]|uniref:prolyl oligopeptidase family serine peptidase n=1 Tax=Brevibacterium paucivorans TaxID=170994 RepID=UPI0032192AC6
MSRIEIPSFCVDARELQPVLSSLVEELKAFEIPSQSVRPDDRGDAASKKPEVSPAVVGGRLLLRMADEGSIREIVLPDVSVHRITGLVVSTENTLAAAVQQAVNGDDFELYIFDISGESAKTLTQSSSSGRVVTQLGSNIAWLERNTARHPVRLVMCNEQGHRSTLIEMTEPDRWLSLQAVDPELLVVAGHGPDGTEHFVIDIRSRETVKRFHCRLDPDDCITACDGSVWTIDSTRRLLLRWAMCGTQWTDASTPLPPGFLPTDLNSRGGVLWAAGRVDGRAAVWIPQLGSDSVWTAPPSGVIRLIEVRDGCPQFIVSSPIHPPELAKGSDGGAWRRPLAGLPGVSALEVRDIPGRPAAVGATLFFQQIRARELHSCPVLALVYGAYGLPNEGAFDPQLAALLTSGVTVAFCHVRGGGEHGPSWHKAGKGEKKQNSLDDFVAILEHLRSQGLCEPTRIGASASSAGALVAASAAVEHPDLIAAVHLNHPFLAPEVLSHCSGGVSAPIDWDEFGDSTIIGHPVLSALMKAEEAVHRSGRPKVWITAGVSDRKAPLSSVIEWAEAYSDIADDMDVVLDLKDGGHTAPRDQTRSWLPIAWIRQQLTAPVPTEGAPR